MAGSTDFHLPGWLRWLLGSITFLGIAILILSVVLGVRAGQQQLEIRSRQQIAISLQNAIDLQARGNIEAAFNAYRSVLVLDPNNPTATEGIQNLLDTAEDDSALAGNLGSANQNGSQTASNSGSANGQMSQRQSDLDQAGIDSTAAPLEVAASPKEVNLFDTAQQAFKSNHWTDVVDALTELRSSNLEYRQLEVTELLYTAHLTLAMELESRNNVEEAMANYDAAIEVHPSPIGAQVGKELLNKYVELLSIEESDHWRLIAALEGIHQADRNYRDVRTRLQSAYVSHGDFLVSTEDWCMAVTQYDNAAELAITPGLNSKRTRYQKQCDEEGSGSGPIQRPTSESTVVDRNTQAESSLNGSTAATITKAPADASSSSASSSASAASTRQSEISTATEAEEPATEEEAITSVVSSPSAATGRILYAAKDIADNRFRVFLQPVAGSGNAALVVEDGLQATFRADGGRLIYSNLRSDSIGLTAFDPGNGLTLRFTDFAEDSFPSWSPDGNRIVFATTREGDRRWRIFIVWAEEGGATTNHSFGETPSWHPSQDLIVYRGCDERGNACGLWTMDGNGGSRSPLTSVVEDSHPTWSPDGRYIVFMSSGRDGNVEIYQLATSSGQVTRLTSSPSIDGTPTVSPNGDWVAFLSDRNGAWSIWQVPISGGEAQVIAPLTGQPGEWQAQRLQWVP